MLLPIYNMLSPTSVFRVTNPTSKILAYRPRFRLWSVFNDWVQNFIQVQNLQKGIPAFKAATACHGAERWVTKVHLYNNQQGDLSSHRKLTIGCFVCMNCNPKDNVGLRSIISTKGDKPQSNTFQLKHNCTVMALLARKQLLTFMRLFLPLSLHSVA